MRLQSYRGADQSLTAMKTIQKLLTMLMIAAIWPLTAALPQSASPPEYHPGVIVIKLKNNTSGARVALSRKNMMEQVRKLTGFHEYRQVFRSKKFSNGRMAASHLENIYKLQVSASGDIRKKINALRNLDFIEYAEPLYRNSLLYIPDDPQADSVNGLQDYLAVIRAYEAWDVERSDTAMIIGIIDTGVKFDHEDLDNVAFNYADPVNGLDDDNDGYTDNYRGWDVSDNDNDPTADKNGHGTLVTGVSSAKTDNGTGMAGAGFRSRFLPVKIQESSSGYLTNEYEGIIYAADHGCKIINLSWGVIEGYSAFAQDVINYAVLEKDAVVIAAGGNKDWEYNYYPASYDHVLSVGPVNVNDEKPFWGSYSYHIDLTAPAHQIFSTKNDGAYGRDSGTSYASPMVAGTAALIRARFPQMTALQVMEQLRVTSDDIYGVGNNMDYYGMLGHGRLNMHRALTDTVTPSVRIRNHVYKARYGQWLFAGDTVMLSFEIVNYLRNAANLNVAISNPSGNVALLSPDNISIPSLGEMESFNNYENPIIFVINDGVQPGERLLFRFDMTADGYTDFQYLQLFVTPGYLDISDSVLTATISGSGEIGYTGPSFEHGNGITFNGKTIASHAGLIISTDSAHVPDNVTDDFINFTKSTDFQSETTIGLYDNSTADADARAVYKPYNTLQGALNLRVGQKTLAWQHNGDWGFLLFEYRLINTGDTALTGLNAGIYADWDVGDYQTNAADWDSLMNLGYIFDKQNNSMYAGLALISGQQMSYRAIDLDNLNGNTADIGTAFPDSLKHGFLANISYKKQAGVAGAGNDVAHIAGAKGMTVNPNKVEKVVIAMLAASSLNGLKAALDSAKSRYREYLDKPPVAEVFYACRGDSTVVDPAGDIYEFYKDAALTQRIDSGRFIKTAPVTADTLFYAVNLDSGYVSDAMSLPVRVVDRPKAVIEASSDTIDLRAENAVELFDRSENASVSYWLLPDNTTDTSSMITEIYQTTGQYDYSLIAEGIPGCADTAHYRITVVNITALSESTALEKITIFPNPVTGVLKLTLREEAVRDLLFELHDISGKTVRRFIIRKGASFGYVNLSDMPRGLYLLKSKDVITPFSAKVIKH